MPNPFYRVTKKGNGYHYPLPLTERITCQFTFDLSSQTPIELSRDISGRSRTLHREKADWPLLYKAPRFHTWVRPHASISSCGFPSKFSIPSRVASLQARVKTGPSPGTRAHEICMRCVWDALAYRVRKLCTSLVERYREFNTCILILINFWIIPTS